MRSRFRRCGGAPGIDITPQDQVDMIAYLKLLR
jgi:hypothetical protein